jgi:protein-S-isoprenylcysteine O-methyltransferase Ste14
MCFSIEFIQSPWFQSGALFFYLCIYYTVHSWLAGKKILRLNQQHSRILYNIISLICFFPILIILWIWRIPIIPNNLILLKAIGILLVFVGLTISWKSFQSFDGSAFLGLSPETTENNKLNINGLYKYTRHPMYFGSIITFIGAFLWRPDILMLIFTSLSILYIYIGSWSEEKKLIIRFGIDYKRYQNETPQIFPKLIGKFMCSLFNNEQE